MLSGPLSTVRMFTHSGVVCRFMVTVGRSSSSPRSFATSSTPAMPNELRVGEWPTLKPLGDYELDVGVAAVNAKTIRRTISIQFREWHEQDEAAMFSKGLIVQRK